MSKKNKKKSFVDIDFDKMMVYNVCVFVIWSIFLIVFVEI